MTLDSCDFSGRRIRLERDKLGSNMVREFLKTPPEADNPYDTKEDLLKWIDNQFERFGDIFKASIYGSSVYVIRNPRYAEHVLRNNWQNYVKGHTSKRIGLLLDNGLMVSEGEFWKKHRRMAQPAFHRKAIAALIQPIVAVNADLARRWEHAAKKCEAVNVTREISQAVLKLVLMSIFGDDYDEVKHHFDIVSEEAARNFKFAQEFRAAGEIVSVVVARRRQRKTLTHDILSILMEARDRNTGDLMSDRQLTSEIKTLIVAGHETTASTLGWMWYLLSQHPKVQERLVIEIDHFLGSASPTLDVLPKLTFARQVIDETMRLYPAGWLMTRKAIRDDRLDEYFVPAKTEIYVPPYFIHRHPDLWSNPDHFDPDRFAPDLAQGRHPMSMLPFSAGPRNCIGEPLARMEMQIHLIMITAKSIRLRYSEKKPPELDAGINLRSKSDLIMKPELFERSNLQIAKPVVSKLDKSLATESTLEPGLAQCSASQTRK